MSPATTKRRPTEADAYRVVGGVGSQERAERLHSQALLIQKLDDVEMLIEWAILNREVVSGLPAAMRSEIVQKVEWLVNVVWRHAIRVGGGLLKSRSERVVKKAQSFVREMQGRGHHAVLKNGSGYLAHTAPRPLPLSPEGPLTENYYRDPRDSK